MLVRLRGRHHVEIPHDCRERDANDYLRHILPTAHARAVSEGEHVRVHLREGARRVELRRDAIRGCCTGFLGFEKRGGVRWRNRGNGNDRGVVHDPTAGQKELRAEEDVGAAV